MAYHGVPVPSFGVAGGGVCEGACRGTLPARTRPHVSHETNAKTSLATFLGGSFTGTNRYSELDTTLTGHEDPRDVEHDRAQPLKKVYSRSDDSLAQPDADDSPSPVFMGLGTGQGGNAGVVGC